MGISTLYIIYNIKIHKELKNGLKNRILSEFHMSDYLIEQIFAVPLLPSSLQWNSFGFEPRNSTKNIP